MSNYEELVCYFIISCKKNEHLHSNFTNKNEFIIVGDENIDEKYKLINNKLILKVNDGYLGLPQKVILAYEAFINLKEFDQYTHVYKIDDDCKIFKKMSKEFYDFINKNDYSGALCNYVIYPNSGKRGWHLKYKHDDKEYWANRPYDGHYVPWLRGSNYTLSKPLINKINKIWHYDNLDLLGNTEVFEDLAIGKVCFFLNVKLAVFPKDLKPVKDEFEL